MYVRLVDDIELNLSLKIKFNLKAKNVLCEISILKVKVDFNLEDHGNLVMNLNPETVPEIFV